MINWLLNFDLNDNTNQDIHKLSAHDKILSRFHNHQHYYSSTVKQRRGGRNVVSTNTGSLYLYNQGEFYFNTPQVICVMCIWDNISRFINWQASNDFVIFSITYFLKKFSMDEAGYLYVPKQCENLNGIKCHLHVFFHGCGVGR